MQTDLNKQSSIQYRPGTFSDHEAIAALHTNSWRSTYRGILSDHYLEHEVEQERLEAWHKRLQEPEKNLYVTVAIQNEQLIGFCCIILDNDPVFGSLIDNLHVIAGQQKSGIGKMLISSSAKIMIEKAISKKTYLWVYENNINARAAYDHLGATNFETLEKLHADGSMARSCRYIWNDAAQLIIHP